MSEIRINTYEALFLFPQSGKEKVASREDRSVRWIAAKSQFFAMVVTVKGDPATGPRRARWS